MEKEDIIKVTGDNIKRFRAEKKLSTTELAKRLKVSQSSVSSWENGRAFPRASVFADLAKIFDTTIDELIGTQDHSIINTPLSEYTPKDSKYTGKTESVDLLNLLQSSTTITVEGKTLNSEQKRRLRYVIDAIFSDKLK